MFRSLISSVPGLVVAALAGAGITSASPITGVNAWQLTVSAFTAGTDSTGFSVSGFTSDTSNSHNDPRTFIEVTNECGGGPCSETGLASMGTFLAVANLETLSLGVMGTGGGPDTLVQTGAELQLNVPLVGSIAPGNQAVGSVTMNVHGTAIPDAGFEENPVVAPSLTAAASITTCTFDSTFGSSNGDCVTPDYVDWTSEPQFCDSDPHCASIQGAFPATLTSAFLVDSSHTILHLDIAVGVGARGNASADLSHTATFEITPPPGFTVDFSGILGSQTSAVPEPKTYGVLFAAFLAFVFFARRRSKAQADATSK